jgi:hypothetical protein
LAKLQGALLDLAQLQGASLRGASLDATDLWGARLWRSDGGALSTGDAASAAALRLPDLAEAWAPEYDGERSKAQLWDGAAYEHLREMIDALPAGQLREDALNRIKVLDCTNHDETLPPCDPPYPPPKPPPGAVDWQKRVEEARSADDKAYVKALAAELRSLVCSGGGQAIYVLRGTGFQSGLYTAGPAGSDLIGKLVNRDSKDCPVAAALTDADRAQLLQIKQGIEKAGKS